MGINSEREVVMSNYNPFSLEGKTILVTGASSGIGQATAIECSKMGAKLVITGRNAERLQQTFDQLEGVEHRQIIAELTDKGAVDVLVSSCPEFDGVVLCAGKGALLPISFCNTEKFLDVFTTNFFSPIELLRLLAKRKKLVRGSSAVVVSSIGGVEIFATGNAMYGTSKAALNSAMRFFAKEFAPKGVRVNSVNPGRVNTKLIQSGKLSDEQLQADIQKYPLKRYGEPIEIAHGIIYLLSDAAAWVTGHSLIIDGGVTI